MPTELIVAYAVFIVAPVGLALSIYLRRRSVEEKLARYDGATPSRSAREGTTR